MTPLSLGIFASANTTIPTSFESIATVTVGSGGAADVTFSSIPATFTHLQIRYLARTNAAFVNDFIGFTFNSDTGSNYSEHVLFGNGTSASAGATTNATTMYGTEITGANATASIFGAGVIDILDYANTNKNKTSRALGGDDRNGAGEIRLQSNDWRNTSAITTIIIKPIRTSSFVQYSHFALYGIKGA